MNITYPDLVKEIQGFCENAEQVFESLKHFKSTKNYEPEIQGHLGKLIELRLKVARNWEEFNVEEKTSISQLFDIPDRLYYDLMEYYRLSVLRYHG